MDGLFTALGHHGRPVCVVLVNAKCMACDDIKRCLAFDSSDEEYSEMYFCRGCIDLFFESKKGDGPEKYKDVREYSRQ